MTAQGAWDWTKVPAELSEKLTTLEQRETFGMLRSGMSQKQISQARTCAVRNVQQMGERIRMALQAAGYDPENGMTMVAPPPQVLSGRSSLVKIDPETGAQSTVLYWNKSGVKHQAESLSKFADSLVGKIKPAKPIPASKARADEDLMSAIFIGDAHIGMYAYQPETKHSDFDSNIAADELRRAIDNLVDRSPVAAVGLLVDVGDFMHANTSHNKTFAGTEVDVDTRFERVMDIAASVMEYAISKMLTKFQRVVVVIAKGNHNPDAAVAVQKIVAAYFRNEPRVDVLRTSGHFHYIEWGRWLIGVHHGDKVKAKELPGVMARDMAEAWGRSRSRMWALGHFHHQEVLELSGCTVYKFGALPPVDAWHASMGYGSVQSMQMIVFRKDGGRESTLIYELERPRTEPDLRIA
jgi:hypothetical protein